MIRVRKIDHVCLRVSDVLAASRRYSLQFGLTIRERSADRALLAAAAWANAAAALAVTQPGAQSALPVREAIDRLAAHVVAH